MPLVLRAREPAGSPEPPAMALRSRSPAVHERTVLLDGKHGLDLESGSSSESESDSELSNVIESAAGASSCMAVARGALVALLAIGWMVIFHDKICGVVSHCGCTWPWDGGWRKCNIHNHDGPRCPWCVASAASKLLDVVSQKSAPLAIVAVHLVQECRQPLQKTVVSERQHERGLFAIGAGAALVFAVHLPTHGLFLAAVPVLIAAALLGAPFRWRSSDKPPGCDEMAAARLPVRLVALPIAAYMAVELSWLLLFFVLDPSYPWFGFYTRALP